MSLSQWQTIPLSHVAEIRTGISKSGQRVYLDPVTLPYLRVANVQDGHLDLTEVKPITVEKKDRERYLLHHGDVLLTEGGDADKLGRGTVWRSELTECLHQNHVFVVRPCSEKLLPEFLSALTGSAYGKAYFLQCSKQSTNLASINSSQLKAFPVLLPPLQEQQAIIEILGTWDKAIALTARLIAAKGERKRGLMQQLLSGTRRFPQFATNAEMQPSEIGPLPSDWRYVRIGDVSKHVSARNSSNDAQPVLSCTKYDGLVDSLAYFGRQIFSSDTSTYKIVRRGQFAYATNHIEEGSIGYQNLHDSALISPMYTVFETDMTIDDRYLYALLKTETYRQLFERNTSSSVNRRGSLRWPEFSRIKIPIPPLLEQRAIADVLDTCNEELRLLERKLALLREQKRGLMARLLTGQVRVTP